MSRKGYVLIEVLVASVLLSLAVTGLYTGMMEGSRAQRVIQETNQIYDPLRNFWRRLEKDLKNSVYLRDEAYIGKRDEMIFSVIQMKNENDNKHFELRKIQYFVEDGVLKRSDSEISNRLVKEKTKEKIALKGFDQIKFQYAYLDEEEKLLFDPFWLEEPYFGIPKAVKIELTIRGFSFSKLISIPQGRWGHIQSREKSIHE